VAATAAIPPPPPLPTNTLTINTGPLVRTPPLVARSNPRSSFQEIRNYTTITGGTPGKGRARNPTNQSAGYEEDCDRLHTCGGILYFTKQIRKCFICNTNTNVVCIGCKRWYCIENCDQKLMKFITDTDSRVEFMTGDRPPGELVIHGVAANGNTKEFCTVENRCYHMWHWQFRKELTSLMDHIPSRH
jgi:hypothetical protein